MSRNLGRFAIQMPRVTEDYPAHGNVADTLEGNLQSAKNGPTTYLKQNLKEPAANVATPPGSVKNNAEAHKDITTENRLSSATMSLLVVAVIVGAVVVMRNQ
jgi:hypothetical protein